MIQDHERRVCGEFREHPLGCCGIMDCGNFPHDAFYNVPDCPSPHNVVKRKNEEPGEHPEITDELPFRTAGDCLERPHGIFFGMAADNKFRYHYREPQDHNEENIDQDKRRTAVFPGDVGEFPYIPETDG